MADFMWVRERICVVDKDPSADGVNGFDSEYGPPISGCFHAALAAEMRKPYEFARLCSPTPRAPKLRSGADIAAVGAVILQELQNLLSALRGASPQLTLYGKFGANYWKPAQGGIGHEGLCIIRVGINADSPLWQAMWKDAASGNTIRAYVCVAFEIMECVG